MSLAGFAIKYADEALAVGEALASVIAGIALPSDERAKVEVTIDKLVNAAGNITKALKKDPTLGAVKISKADIKAAIKEVMAEEATKASK